MSLHLNTNVKIIMKCGSQYVIFGGLDNVKNNTSVNKALLTP